MNDKISVVVPIYNSEKYLYNCLTSICNNSYKNLEIILINDGSTDGSYNICKNIAEKDSRIIIINQENKGVSKSRNFGIEKSTGKYITFIDSDDFIQKDYFSQLLSAHKKSNSDLTICSITQTSKDSKRDFKTTSGKIDFSNLHDNSKNLWKDLNINFLLYGPCNKLYDLEIIKNNKIYFPTDTSYGEDLLFNFRYLKYVNIIQYISSVTYFYNRQDSNSLSKKYRENMFENGLRLNDCMKMFFQSKNLYDNDAKKFLSRRIFDDGYNSLFSIFTKQCTLTLTQKYKKIKLILNNQQFVEAIQTADINDYSKFYVSLMKFKLSFLFLIVNKLRTMFNN